MNVKAGRAADATSAEQTTPPRLLILLPSLRISGGVQEVLKLGKELSERGVDVRVVALWKHPHPSSTMELPVDFLSSLIPRKRRAILEYGVLLGRFFPYVRKWMNAQNGMASLMLTHFSTFPFAWFAPHPIRLFCFNQDMEWLFVPTGILRKAVRWLILSISRRSKVITSNSFISEQYEQLGIAHIAQASTWADPFWLDANQTAAREIDIVMLLRRGAVKRLDLYIKLIQSARVSPSLRCAIVTPDTSIYEQIRTQVDVALLRPDRQEMKELFATSKVFVLLSDIEGFGLPPLEAMGAGCIPACRNSGGVRCYMKNELAENLISKHWDIHEIDGHVRKLIKDEAKQEELSALSRQIFRNGLEDATRERRRCFDLVAQACSGSRP